MNMNNFPHVRVPLAGLSFTYASPLFPFRRPCTCYPHSHRMESLVRHALGDWGNACGNDAIETSKPAKGYGDNCDWIITKADRSVTTFLLPDAP